MSCVYFNTCTCACHSLCTKLRRAAKTHEYGPPQSCERLKDMICRAGQISYLQRCLPRRLLRDACSPESPRPCMFITLWILHVRHTEPLPAKEALCYLQELKYCCTVANIPVLQPHVAIFSARRYHGVHFVQTIHGSYVEITLVRSMNLLPSVEDV